MNLIDEAVIIEIFGIRMYAFGLYIALGAVAALIVLAIAGRIRSLKGGTVPLTALCAGICGLIVSRIFFCLLNQELGQITPFSFFQTAICLEMSILWVSRSAIWLSTSSI